MLGPSKEIKRNCKLLYIQTLNQFQIIWVQVSALQYLQSELIPNAASKILCSEHLQSEVLHGDSKDYEAKQTLAYNDSTHL